MRWLNSTLGRKIVASFLLLDAVLVTVGVASLVSTSRLGSRIEAVNTRDVVPLQHLRTAQNKTNTIVITGFAAAATPDKAVKQAMADSAAEAQEILTRELGLLLDTIPSELRPQAEALVTTYEEFVAADEAFKAGATGPQAAALGANASALYGETEAAFEVVASALAKDAVEQQQVVHSISAQTRVVTLGFVGAGIALGIALGALLARSVPRRTTVVLDALGRLADGDLRAELPDLGHDELGRMARALDSGLRSLRAALHEVTESAVALEGSAAGLNTSATDTATSVERSAHGVQEMGEDAASVTRVVGDAASSTVELGSSIREISENAQEAARIAGQAVGVIDATNATVSQLGHSSQEIGNVIQVIQNIAAQTSLLALNATIEAARAGEAGRGFAVVAGEVKELARETAEATESVIQRVQAIQADTEGAVSAMGEIGEIIGRINSYQSSIAAAVEEQSVTSDAIGTSVSHALTRTEAIAHAIDTVSGAARGSADAVSSTRSLAADVADRTAALRRVVGAFRV